MSRERAILRRLKEGDNRGDFFISNELILEIQELLAQPEPEEGKLKVLEKVMNNLLLFKIDYIERDEKGDICVYSCGYTIEAISMIMAVTQFYVETNNKYHIVMIRELLKTGQEYQKVIDGRRR